MIDPNKVPTTPFDERDTLRLISTVYIDEPAMAPLVNSPSELSFLETIEGLTSPGQATGMSIPAGVVGQELLSEHDGYGWTYVNAAFCYTRPSGNRFSDANRGAWYACWGEGALLTAQSEVGWHLTHELSATGVFENITAYRELLAGFMVDFYDLRGLDDDSLGPDIDISYPLGQTLATSLRQVGAHGVIYPSTRYDGGQCLAAFRPRAVQNIRQGNTWQFEWAGNAVPNITPL